MLNAIRKQLNPATVMAFVALVFATTGGALAVTSHSGGSGGGSRDGGATANVAKSRVKPKAKPGPRGPAGSKGATGPAGPKGETGAAGPAGSKGETGAVGSTGLKGETGAAGTNGTNGTNGESLVSATLGEGEGGCNAGGSQFTVNGKTTTACNGEKGEPGETGFTKHLPGGDTETGVYSTIFPGNQETESTFLPISLPIPLPVPIEESKTFIVSLEEQHHSNGKQPPAECPGSVAEPTAGKGAFCLYEQQGSVPEHASLLFLGVFNPEFGTKGVGTTGAMLNLAYFNSDGTAQAYGTWAVTAP